MHKLALLLFLSAIARPVLAESTEEMLSSCRRLAEANVANTEVELPQDFETGRCWGAFAVIQKVTALVIAPSKQPALLVCSPSESTRTQYIAIFVEYTKRNPRRLNEDFFFVALTALREAFPCGKP